MDISVNVVNQKLRIATNHKTYVSGTQEFIRFIFNLSNDWDGLTVFAQFGQGDASYNQYLDAENSVYLPSEIVPGICTLTLYGSMGNIIATTDYLTLTIDENILVSNAESTEISTSLYNQLVTRIVTLEEKIGDGSSGTGGTESGSGGASINITTSITADSTDKQIPSAKAVYDFINETLVGGAW